MRHIRQFFSRFFRPCFRARCFGPDLLGFGPLVLTVHDFSEKRSSRGEIVLKAMNANLVSAEEFYRQNMSLALGSEAFLITMFLITRVQNVLNFTLAFS